MSRVPVLYLAPWVDFGGTDKATIDWFRFIDRARFAPSLITTQPSPNRRLAEVVPYAEEVWPLPDMFKGADFPQLILDFIHSREVEVLHLMNSRLGFDLLPDLGVLDRPPAVVVQLHVEEEDRSGYVRYVTTRYGNLVDAFSLTHRQLAEAVQDYGMPAGKCRVIHGGVDAAREFSPELVRSLEQLPGRGTRILYPGRLVAQKDPLLMAEVAAGLRDTGLDFCVHVVGDGELETAVRTAVHERDLAEHVFFHPPTNEIGSWLAACDLLLMTSVFEGIPYVIYEALSMEVPVVAPALPGNVELMADEGGELISPRDDVAAYVSALRRLVEDGELRQRIGRGARQRMLDHFSVERSAAEHEQLYEELLAKRARRREGRRSNGPYVHDDAIRFRTRPTGEQPLVSLIVPCFDHGKYLKGCLEAIRAQTYPALETIVVDDASTDPETIELMAQLERDEAVQVVRMPRNSGPSAARNAGVERAQGRYMLPVDADNLLVPDAVERLVAQLQGAGERIGFVYPNLQYFGNRDDYFEAPEYNLHSLMTGNFCDSSSLIDREVFDKGLRYPEDVVLGHEDWDFALSLATRGVEGEPARNKTLLYRKHGFTRSDAVEYASEAFQKAVRARHTGLYGREEEVKPRWSPALSLIGLQPDAGGDQGRAALAARARNQSCIDFELLLRLEAPWGEGDLLPPVRRIPAALPLSRGDAIATAVDAARGRYLLVTAGTGAELLGDAGFVEKVLRTFDRHPTLGAIALTDAGDDAYPFKLLRHEDKLAVEPHGVVWRADPDTDLPDAWLRPEDELPSLVRVLAGRVRTQWRHAPSPSPSGPEPGAGDGVVRLSRARARPGDVAEAKARLSVTPILGRLAEPPRRWQMAGTWLPPETHPLCRHRRVHDGAWLITNDRRPPPGYELHFDLGAIQRFPVQGTAPLEGPDGRNLGYLEQAPLPLLDPVTLARDPATGQHVLVGSDHDPIASIVEPIKWLGFIESYPIQPRHPPDSALQYGILGLVRGVDREGRRHVYGLGELPAGEVAGELGALHQERCADSIAAGIAADGSFVTERYQPPSRHPRPSQAVRWTLAPAAWRGPWSLAVRARAVLRRSATTARHVAVRQAPGPALNGIPTAYLLASDGLGRLPLYSALHSVTGDQLLTTDPRQAADLGYADVALLGYLAPAAPVTGRLGTNPVAVPWASGFGLAARQT